MRKEATVVTKWRVLVLRKNKKNEKDADKEKVMPSYMFIYLNISFQPLDIFSLGLDKML